MRFPQHPQAVKSIFIAAFIAWLALIYASTMKGLWATWQTEEYGHGLLIPFISCLWVVRLLQEKKLRLTPNWEGIFLLLVGLELNCLGILLANNWSSQISLLVSITGFVVVLAGWRGLKCIFAPVLFLLFAIPLPPTIYPVLTSGMQLISSDLGVQGLQLFGFPVFQEGNVIDLGGYKLQVAEACSGLRYLFPLMALGCLSAFLFHETAWKRWIVFLSTIPIAIGLNGLRIVIIGITVDYWGSKMAEGFLHELEGFVVFVGCITGLMLVHKSLSLFGKKENAPLNRYLEISWKAPLWADKFRVSFRTLMLIFLVMTIGTSTEMMAASRPEAALPNRFPFSMFPMKIEGWSGATDVLSSEMLSSLKLNDYIMANYTKESSYPSINFYVAYYQSQQQGSAIHSPKICIPGAGWEIVSIDPIAINIGNGTSMPLVVNKAIIKKDAVTQLVFYWFRESGYDVASSYEAKWLLLRNSFRSGRSDGSLIRLSTSISGEADEPRAEERLTSFISAVYPILPEYLPSGN